MRQASSAAESQGASRHLVPRAALLDTLRILARILLPALAKGVIIRRPLALSVAETFDLDRRAVRQMQRLRYRYGDLPLMVSIPGRTFALIFDPADAHRILHESPDQFAPASREKRQSLSHFEPNNVLISNGAERDDRRRFNEDVLDTGHLVHQMAEHFLRVVDDEAARLCHPPREIVWREFAAVWFRMVRRVLFGDAAGDDHRLSELMARLRRDANWAFRSPQRSALRQELLTRIGNYLAAADPASLAGMMAYTRRTPLTEPAHQVPQWLFAFDPTGIATFRALALLAAHPVEGHIARDEVEHAAGHELPFLRTVVLESLRLWPTTPLLLRDSTTDTLWRDRVLPAHTGVILFTPFFHRDDERLPFAHRFSPDIWRDGIEAVTARYGLFPFSEGPAMCPGRNLVMLLSTGMIAALMRRARVRLLDDKRLAREALPGTLNHFGLRFQLKAL